MLTGKQIRAARAYLNWSQKDLSEKSGVSIASIRRLEPNEGIPSITVKTLVQIQDTLEKAGVSFGEDSGQVVLKFHA
ncbi:helix-turn-helix domain-containing protein [Kordiimonas marina]|uniref:helix-turn-helix domain-containing protein n=1 Tax=Kordiimonas marina TaxID=2872312 RepID=UPI001FF62515|nr:helix-turn-helix transcriptional regulator [Kordiimonas marina]MCJ9429662.1 helix-turn-helix domain-containing protein [Kordiimonas marina]